MDLEKREKEKLSGWSVPTTSDRADRHITSGGGYWPPTDHPIGIYPYWNQP
jgi:hypothetical protein